MTDLSRNTKKPVVGLHLGIDIGSISLNTVLIDSDKRIIENRYDYCHGKPFHRLREVLGQILGEYKDNTIESLSLTGSGGKLASELIGGHYVNEIIAQSTSVSEYFPRVKTIIEMGGEDSKLIFMDTSDGVISKLMDFQLNNLCAAGTGSFLDQQAKRIGVSIEKEFGELALKSENPPRIAGRCSVFAKSDMIHLQQIATPVHDIVAGLCFAVARNFISSMAKGKKLEFPVIFQGGVAANAGVERAFREILNAGPEDLIIPDYYASMGAIGAVLHTFYTDAKAKAVFKGLDGLDHYLSSGDTEGKYMDSLIDPKTLINKNVRTLVVGSDKTDVYLGLDVGSLSTNVVLIDDDNKVVARRYLPTASKPLEAIRRGMLEIFGEVGDRVVVKAAGSTGSGRYLTGDFIGADVIRNEITAQATAAIAYDKEVDTVFEIGGQDSKYISIDHGVVVDFEMNKVCAAGTGSFLEEQAEKLGINIIEEFGNLALQSKKPTALGDRCTVFMESDLNSHQQKGAKTEDLVAGLAYSIVLNYLHMVVGKKKVGNHILFQGGVTNNKAVVAAFQQVTGKKIHVPPHFDVTGAIGAAMLARDHVKENNIKTRFKGWDISKIPYTVDKFICKKCPNYCEIRRVRIEGEKKPLFYGARCELFEVEERKNKGQGIPNYFNERLSMLMGDYQEEEKDDRISIGIPRALMLFYQQFPFWRTFFKELGFRVVISSETDSKLMKKSLDVIVAETCLPVEVMHGHIYDLLEKKVDYVFVPFIITEKADKDDPTYNYNCTYVQTYPFMVKTALSAEERAKLLIPALNFKYFGRVLNKDLSDFMWEKFKTPRKKVIDAIMKADRLQTEYERSLEIRGKEVLNNLPDDKESVVVLGRPYNTGDPALNMNLVEKLINLDVIPVPTEFLPISGEHITDDYRQMYWPNGKSILAAARIIGRHKKLHAVYMSNYRCGPDSFLSHFVSEEMAGKPYLELEIDEHSADAGLITRCEAFLDSMRGSKLINKVRNTVYTPKGFSSSPTKERTLYFPYMCDAGEAIAAASRTCGIDAHVLPRQDEKDLELGRKYTSGKECFPMICTTGSFLKKLMEPGTDSKKISFFMPDHNGPCRFGQYNKFQSVLFHRLGYNDVRIISPSNDTSYTEISAGQGTKFRYLAWKGIVAVDLLRKLKQEHKPYELLPGSTERIYNEALSQIVSSIEHGAGDLVEILRQTARMMSEMPMKNGIRKPVVAVVGEIFMRDNPFCNGFLIDRLEKNGAETWIAPFGEWLSYTTYRYRRDSIWKGDYKGLIKANIQDIAQRIVAKKMQRALHGMYDSHRDIELHEMLNACGPYIHRHYDGDPALNLGTSVILSKTGISGIANILPFTCMPGTVIESVSDRFKRDHNNIPYVNIAYDGQDNTTIDMRIQAFMHQAREYAGMKGYDKDIKKFHQSVISL
ncbi:MAG TPA: acyl-CoA dehydratase activase [Bacteroidales bacterium]|nr:acyl-CoA dehydratase activase [Bacteroidales bacterium]